MKEARVFSVFLMLIFLQLQANGQEYPFLKDAEFQNRLTRDNGIDQPVTIKVIYDNYAWNKEMKPDWGFSLVIEGLEKEILFDAGTKPDVFESNFSKMGINAADIDLIVLSHEHGDHTAGLSAFAKMKKDIPVIMPHSFSEKFKADMTNIGFDPLLVKEPASICNHLYTSGEFDYLIPEQSLVLVTKQGLVVITGCSHPGIVEMLKLIKATFNKNIYMVLGGFHLLEKSKKEMDLIISEMKALGVVKCGATHCTGDKQIRMFREAFGENYVEMGAGNSIEF